MNQVIAVASAIGGGKTTLARALAGQLGDAAVIHFDSYEKVSEQPMRDIAAWMAAGARFDDFHLPGLAAALGDLKEGRPVVDPLAGREIRPGTHILFETPLGREHAETGAYIDRLIWIDVPLEIALARKIAEHTAVFLDKYRPEDHAGCIQWLQRYLKHYLSHVRDLLVTQRRRLAADADIVVDGTVAPDSLAREVIDKLHLDAG